MQVTTIGLDLAKHVFQIHGIDAAEEVVVRRQLRRSQVKALMRHTAMRCRGPLSGAKQTTLESKPELARATIR
jgi:hypothetical protein